MKLYRSKFSFMGAGRNFLTDFATFLYADQRKGALNTTQFSRISNFNADVSRRSNLTSSSSSLSLIPGSVLSSTLGVVAHLPPTCYRRILLTQFTYERRRIANSFPTSTASHLYAQCQKSESIVSRIHLYTQFYRNGAVVRELRLLQYSCTKSRWGPFEIGIPPSRYASASSK